MNYTIPIVIFFLGLGGIFLGNILIRIFLWFLSVFPFAFGYIAWKNGGIAEPFPGIYLYIFCAIAFWPMIGCIIGEFIRLKYKYYGGKKIQIYLSL